MKLKWKDLTSHQKYAEIELAKTMTIEDIEKIISQVEDPFGGRGRLMVKLENNMQLLKLHIMKHGAY